MPKHKETDWMDLQSCLPRMEPENKLERKLNQTFR